MHRLPRHTPLLRHRTHRMALGDHRQHRQTALLRHAQLPHRGSAEDQPKQLSTINRRLSRLTRSPVVEHQAEQHTADEPTRGLEPLTARLQVGCATSCATPAGHGDGPRGESRDCAGSQSAPASRPAGTQASLVVEGRHPAQMRAGTRVYPDGVVEPVRKPRQWFDR